MSSTSIGRRQVSTGAPPAGALAAKSILARLDRISVWSLPFMFTGIIGTGPNTRGRNHEEISP